MSSKKKNSLAKVNDEVLTEQLINVTSADLNNESVEPTAILDDDLRIVSIPKILHAHFECVVGKHVYIDKPWTQIPYKKIIDHLQKEKTNSCFWKFRKELEGIQNENVLVGYKAFSSTDEEFLICTTDRAKQFIEQTQIPVERELKQRVERSMFRVPGPWESKSSEKDIEDIKSVPAREKITCKWKLSSERLQEEAKFEDANSKSVKNEHVKLEPRYSKEKYECIDVLTMDSCVQATRKMVNREMQTIPRIKDNKCIQSVAVEEEMFQFQPLTKSDKALDDFLEKHVPNLVDQLHYNDLYDLYRDDYKLLKNKNKNENPAEQNSKDIKFFPGYQNSGSKNKYVSCHTWHPTISGVFAISYATNSNALYKSVSIEKTTEEVAKSIEKDLGSYSDNDNNQVPSNNQPEVQLVDENYKEKIISLLNMEFIQRMRVIQLTEEEKTNEQCNQETIHRQLRNSFNFKPHEQLSTCMDFPLVHPDDETLNDENSIINEIQNELSLMDVLNNKEKSDESNVDNNEYESQNKGNIKATSTTKIITSAVEVDQGEYEDKVDHHDSDTDSFYNIWGDDEEWLHGNELRKVVRNIHRKFNEKYDREAREDKLFRLLESEVEYTKMKNKIDNMEAERMKLTKDMFEAGYMYQKLNDQSKKRKKSSSRQNKLIQNSEDSMIKQDNAPPIDEQNSVIIWSINDNMFPKLILESPEEVYCVEFSPRNGNKVVGGLINGQICIWDISGKLDKIDSNDLIMSEKEKKHQRHLWMHMQWSLEVQFKSRVRPAVLSAILESHESMVTAIQWVHPLNEITSLGKLVDVKDGQFSMQFFSASMDGTIKLWDLHSIPMSRSKQIVPTNTRFPRPDKLGSYKSPLSIYNNRLKPSYTIMIAEPETVVCSPITALSFEIPLMQYKYTSNHPLVIGKRQFEYVPTTLSDPPNRFLVVGSIMGHVGIVTWNGYDTYQPGHNKEECKSIWWGHVHDGPINCIKRNAFYPDMHLVCGGHVVSIWSLNYEGGPVWWKRFPDFTNSVLWSTVHPAEFRVSFNNSGVLQFWDFMQYTHQPYYESNNLNITGNGLIGTLSTPLPSIHFIGAEQLTFSEGINELLNYNKNELISFSDSNGMIWMIAVGTTVLEKNKIEEVGRIFQKEIDRRRELDAWNVKYKEAYGPIGEIDVVDSHCESTEPYGQIPVEMEDENQVSKSKQINRQICDETFKWYLNRSGSKSRLSKMREKFTEREKRHMIETMMKKKNVSQQQLDEYIKSIEMKTFDGSDINKIRFQADETYRHIINKLLAVEQTEEYELDVDSKKSVESEEMKKIFEKIHNFVVTDYEAEKDKLNDYIKNNPYKAAQEDWARVIELAERKDKDVFNDPNLFKGPNIRMMCRKLSKKYIDEGYKIKEWKSRKDQHASDRYKMRESKIDKLKATYGKSYDPYWDKGLEPLTMKDAVRRRVTEADDENYEQSYKCYFEEESGDGDICYTDYLSFTGPDSISNDPDRPRGEISKQ